MTTSVPSPLVQPASASRWQLAWLTVAVALTAVAGAYWGTLADIVSIWSRSGTFTHGFLIVPVVVYLVWQQRVELQKITPRPAPLALLFLGGMVALWWLAQLLAVNAMQHFAVVMMIPATFLVLLGSAVMKRLLFPMAYLLFAVPFGEFLVPSLQDITATMTVKALQFTGIPVLWEERFFYIPSGTFEVAEACSGVRYLIASLALGTLYAYISYRSLWRRAVFIALSAVVPVLANGMRAYGIVMIAHLSDYKLAVGVDHFIYGWVFFGAVMLLLFWLGNYFRDPPAVSVAERSVPDVDTLVVSPSDWAWRIMALAMLLSGPLLNYMVQRKAVADITFDMRMPLGVAAWIGPYATADSWTPKYMGASAQQRVEYRRDQSRVQVYAAYYAQQNADAKLINSENSLYDRSGERRLSENVETITLEDGSLLNVHTLLVRTEHSQRLIWNWYVVAGHLTANPLLAKLYEARGRIFGSRSGSAMIALEIDNAEDVPRAKTQLKEFASDMHTALNASVRGAQ